MAFFGLSFRFWEAPPPNQPQIPDILDDAVGSGYLAVDLRFYDDQNGLRVSIADDEGVGRVAGLIVGSARNRLQSEGHSVGSVDPLLDQNPKVAACKDRVCRVYGEEAGANMRREPA